MFNFLMMPKIKIKKNSHSRKTGRRESGGRRKIKIFFIGISILRYPLRHLSGDANYALRDKVSPEDKNLKINGI